jgi:thiamine pyrophosphate-dependent acetolactate synthase large subunit-like protein
MSIVTSDKVDRRRGAAVFLEVLRSEGARYVFGNPGTTELPLIDAFVDATDISYILALQEASAVAATPAVKWAREVTHPDQIPILVRRAFHDCQTAPTRATEIAQKLQAYDAVFALGGKSLITILYTEGSAVPPGLQSFQLSADARDLGRTYSAKLAVVGDIKASLDALLLLLAPKIADRRGAYAALRKAAEHEQTVRRARLVATADAEFDRPVTTPLVAGREMARAIGPETAIVDEAAATLGALRAFLGTASTRQYSFSRGGALDWGMPAAVSYSLGIDRAPVVSVVGDGAALYTSSAVDCRSRKAARNVRCDQQP